MYRRKSRSSVKNYFSPESTGAARFSSGGSSPANQFFSLMMNAMGCNGKRTPSPHKKLLLIPIATCQAQQSSQTKPTKNNNSCTRSVQLIESCYSCATPDRINNFNRIRSTDAPVSIYFFHLLLITILFQNY